MTETAREQIFKAVDTIPHGGQRTFTIRQLIEEVRNRGAELAESTIRTQVASGMCANAPDNHGTTYAEFKRVGHGDYHWRK